MPGALPVLLAAPLDQRGTQPDARFAKSWLTHPRDEVWAPKIILNRARENEKIGFVHQATPSLQFMGTPRWAECVCATT